MLASDNVPSALSGGDRPRSPPSTLTSRPSAGEGAVPLPLMNSSAVMGGWPPAGQRAVPAALAWRLIFVEIFAGWR